VPRNIEELYAGYEACVASYLGDNSAYDQIDHGDMVREIYSTAGGGEDDDGAPDDPELESEIFFITMNVMSRMTGEDGRRLFFTKEEVTGKSGLAVDWVKRASLTAKQLKRLDKLPVPERLRFIKTEEEHRHDEIAAVRKRSRK